LILVKFILDHSS